MPAFKMPATDAASLGKALKKNKPRAAHAQHGGGPMVTVRKDEYKGHKVEIKTTYEIKIDGKPFSGHMEVSSEGAVHYHPLPNYSWPSAVDMVRQVIDSFPREFNKKAGRGGSHGSKSQHRH
jgi:hypothetical protein